MYAIARGHTLVTGRGDTWTARATDLPLELTSLCWFRSQLYASSARDVFVLEADGRFVPLAIGPDTPGTCGKLSSNGTVMACAGERDVFQYDGTTWTRLD